MTRCTICGLDTSRAVCSPCRMGILAWRKVFRMAAARWFARAS